jgi:pimeloyl-ACP methyl ester carboxylesterase
MGFDADGANARILLTPEDVAREGLDFAGFIKPDQPTRETVRSVDQPTTEPALNATAAEFAPPIVKPAGSVRLPRSPRIHDLMAGDPESVLVRTEGDQHVGRYKLNVITGKLTSLSEEILDLSKTSLYDRQGRPRGAVPAHMRVAFPHNYAVDTGAGLLRWKSLDQLAGTKAGAPGFHVAPGSFFTERAVPIGFDENPDLLYLAANIGRDTLGIYGLNLKNGQRTGFAFENPRLDLVEPTPGGFVGGKPLVFDRFTRALAGVRFEGWWRTARWLRPNLQAVQTKLEQTMPGRSIDLLEWDQAEQRFLVLTRGPVDPGTYYIFDAAKARLAEFVRRVPGGDAKNDGQAAVLSFKDRSGLELGALLHLPGANYPKPTALVVLCPTEPWFRARTAHRPEVQALTAMGLAVLQINGRGATGFGIKQREALKPGYEEAQVEDLVSALDYLQKYLPMNLKRVIAMGSDWGGFVALRAVQLHPERFRCAVTLNPTVDPGDWLENSSWTEGAPGPALTRDYYGDAAHLKAAPLVRQAAKVSRPVLLLNYPGRAGSPLSPKYLVARRFAAAVRSAGGTAEFGDLSEDFTRGYPVAKAETYGRIQQFLNSALFSYEVNIGDTKVVPP